MGEIRDGNLGNQNNEKNRNDAKAKKS